VWLKIHALSIEFLTDDLQEGLQNHRHTPLCQSRGIVLDRRGAAEAARDRLLENTSINNLYVIEFPGVPDDPGSESLMGESDAAGLKDASKVRGQSRYLNTSRQPRSVRCQLQFRLSSLVA
jgi:hypothetical protein